MVRMNMKRGGIPLLLALFVFAGTGAARAANANSEAAIQARIAREDQGPSTIDVSGYPQKMQNIYNNVFSRRCMMCHRLSRPINSDYALPSEWKANVDKMMRKPGSNINRRQAKEIIKFLIYDSSVRKKALLEKKLAKEPPAKRAKEEAKIKAVNPQFGK